VVVFGKRQKRSRCVCVRLVVSSQNMRSTGVNLLFPRTGQHKRPLLTDLRSPSQPGHSLIRRARVIFSGGRVQKPSLKSESIAFSTQVTTNESGTAIMQSQKPKIVFLVVATVSALFTSLLANNLGYGMRGATILRKPLHGKLDRAVMSVESTATTASEEMAAGTVATTTNAIDPSSSLTSSLDTKSTGTVVTAFYEGPSKHSISKYRDWAKNLFTLDDPMIVFTDPSFAPYVQEQRELQNAMHKTKIILLDLNKTDTVNMFSLDFWEEQTSKDRQKELHKSYHVYWVWLSKLEFVKRAIEMNPFQSEFFAWVDLGYFRTERWLGQKLLQHIPNALQEDQVLMLDHHHNGHIGAGFIGGFAKGLLRYNKVFYDHLIKQQYTEFIGREEPMLAESCLDEPNLCQLVVSGKHYEKHIWFYMAPFLIFGQDETEASMYVPTVATEKVQSDMVNYLNVIKPPNETRKVLMVVAHPDDEVLWGGEYLIKEGHNVHVVVTSTVNRKTQIRYEEFLAVQEHLGFHGEFLDGRDSITSPGLESHIQQRIYTLICGKNWERIITHGAEGEYGHPHHQMVHDAVLHAVKMCCRSSDKLFVFEPHPSKNHVFSEAKQAVAKLYKSQERILFRTFGDWKEQIVPFEKYDQEAASLICRDHQNPEKKVHPLRQCRLHEMINFASKNATSTSLESFFGQGSGC